jgi:hydrogenase maturation protease
MSTTTRSRNARSLLNPGADGMALIIGLGNPLRGDDAVGRNVAAQIKRQNQPLLKIVEYAGEGTGLIELWANAGIVIVVDAIASGAEPGIIRRFDATQKALPVQFYGGSTHSIGLAEAVELARALHQLPQRLIIFGIEGKRFDIGTDLSPELEKIVPRVVALVLEEARQELKVE